VVQPGTTVRLGLRDWQVHAAPGHDPHSVVLFEPQRRLLISADALWERGFGVVFPELEGEQAFAEVEATLDVIEQLQPEWVLPGMAACSAMWRGRWPWPANAWPTFRRPPAPCAVRGQGVVEIQIAGMAAGQLPASAGLVRQHAADAADAPALLCRSRPWAWVLALLQALAAARAVVWEGDQVRNVD